jgi:hypothetical protein
MSEHLELIEKIVRACKPAPRSYWDLFDDYEGPVSRLNIAINAAVEQGRIVRTLSANGWMFASHPFPGVDIDAAHRQQEATE